VSTPAVHQRNSDQAAYWNGPAGRRWTDRQEMQDLVLAPVSAALLDRARVAKGERVIDIGCGCGATAIELAERVGPKGHVTGLDISAPMLERARERAPANLPLQLILADATVHPFEAGATDLLTSRFGVMFFADPVLSFANMRKALRPGGRMAFAAWREPRKNPWMIVPLQEAYKHVPRLPEMAPDDPGPFAFASEDRVQRILKGAGFTGVAMEPVELTVDLAAGRGLEAAVNGALAIGPVSRALECQAPEQLAVVASSIRAALAARQQDETVPLGASVWIATAVNP
jgi:ubiquinone/menaquinone biosynthesis C-methylase UbiE